jgi:hypothetical protein
VECVGRSACEESKENEEHELVHVVHLGVGGKF